MRKNKYIILIILSLIVVVETIYIAVAFIRVENKPLEVLDKPSDASQNTTTIEKRYITDLPLTYFEGRNMGGDGEFTYLEKMGYQGEIVPVTEDVEIDYKNMNEPFEGFDNLPDMYDLHEPYWGDPTDVDGDGINETVFYYSTAMNHIPHVVSIVKNNNVIFRAYGPSIKLVETEDGNGFYTEEYQWTDIPTANTKITRYIYENGEFIPVWYRRIYVLEVANGIDQISDFYPFKEGTYWEYSGVKKEQQADSSIQESDVTKIVTVESIVREGKITTIYTNNEDIPKITFNGEYLDFSPESTSEQKFTLPITLYKGARWGDEGNLENRDDGYYVWEVENDQQREFNGKTYSCYHISYKQLPDTKYYVFCRGLGIIEEGYMHNGTVMEYKYELVSTNAVN